MRLGEGSTVPRARPEVPPLWPWPRPRARRPRRLARLHHHHRLPTRGRRRRAAGHCVTRRGPPHHSLRRPRRCRSAPRRAPSLASPVPPHPGAAHPRLLGQPRSRRRWPRCACSWPSSPKATSLTCQLCGPNRRSDAPRSRTPCAPSQPSRSVGCACSLQRKRRRSRCRRTSRCSRRAAPLARRCAARWPCCAASSRGFAACCSSSARRAAASPSMPRCSQPSSAFSMPRCPRSCRTAPPRADTALPFVAVSPTRRCSRKRSCRERRANCLLVVCSRCSCGRPRVRTIGYYSSSAPRMARCCHSSSCALSRSSSCSSTRPIERACGACNGGAGSPVSQPRPLLR